jgi:hypothetical protein
VIERRTAHTADLDDATKTAIRALMDAAYVLPVFAPVDVTGELTCDWRPGSVW